MKFVE